MENKKKTFKVQKEILARHKSIQRTVKYVSKNKLFFTIRLITIIIKNMATYKMLNLYLQLVQMITVYFYYSYCCYWQ